MTMHSVRDVITISFVAAILSSCAQEGMPPGGPTDTFPPYIVVAHPSADSTNVSTEVTPRIVFNERMDPTSVEEALFIAPLISFELETNWSGNAYTVVFDDPLLQGLTYLITIASSARDVRGNTMTTSRTVAFSTGSEIEQGVISGTVTSEGRAASGAYVWAYNLREDHPADPTNEAPDYIGQTGRSGDFTFTNLSSGRYRLFAFLDRGRDRRYHAGRDPIGVPTSDISLTPATLIAEDRRLALALSDTTTFSVLSARPRHLNRVDIRFTSPPNEILAIEDIQFRISSLENRAPLGVAGYYVDAFDPASIVLITKSQASGVNYTLALTGLEDRPLLVGDTPDLTANFSAAVNSDEIAPELIRVIPADSTDQVRLKPDIHLVFSEAVRTSSAAIELLDPAGSSVPVNIATTDSVRISVVPISNLAPNTAYTILLYSSRLTDLAGNRLSRTSTTSDTIESTFRTIDPAVFGSITGTVFDNSPGRNGNVVVVLTEVSLPDSTHRITVPAAGPYRIKEILPGKYMIHGYRDLDGNGIHSPGVPVPFAPSEPTTASSDTILVRSGWESEKVDLIFPP
jgi:hypothetical protein